MPSSMDSTRTYSFVFRWRRSRPIEFRAACPRPTHEPAKNVAPLRRHGAGIALDRGGSHRDPVCAGQNGGSFAVGCTEARASGGAQELWDDRVNSRGDPSRMEAQEPTAASAHGHAPRRAPPGSRCPRELVRAAIRDARERLAHVVCQELLGKLVRRVYLAKPD